MAVDAWITLVLWLIWTCGTSIVTVVAVRVWAGDDRMAERMRGAFVLAVADDPEKARGMVRGFAVTVIACWGNAISAAALLYDEFTGMGDQLGSTAWWALVGGGIGVLFVGVGLSLCIVHFNRPRFLVPSRFRWEPGYQEVVAARERGEDVDKFYEARRAVWEQQRD